MDGHGLDIGQNCLHGRGALTSYSDRVGRHPWGTDCNTILVGGHRKTPYRPPISSLHRTQHIPIFPQRDRPIVCTRSSFPIGPDLGRQRGDILLHAPTTDPQRYICAPASAGCHDLGGFDPHASTFARAGRRNRAHDPGGADFVAGTSFDRTVFHLILTRISKICRYWLKISNPD